MCEMLVMCKSICVCVTKPFFQSKNFEVECANVFFAWGSIVTYVNQA